MNDGSSVVYNTWVLEVIYQRCIEIGAISRTGFINQGRGAVWLKLSDGRFWLIYNSRAEWERAGLEHERTKAILSAIDDYNPLNCAVVIAFSSLEDKFETVTCLIKLD
ncbi:MAG: hypothetical protein ACRC32_04570 [Chroococcidiopsis sp.]